MHRIFVYGTLKKGERLDMYLEGQTYIKDAIVRGTLYDLGWYPTLVLDGEGYAPGEVYEVDEETFLKTKSMEEEAGYDTVKTNTLDGEEVELFTFKKAPNNRIITDFGKTHKCEECGTIKEVTLAPDPYDSEINDDYTPIWMCDNCRSNRADEI